MRHDQHKQVTLHRRDRVGRAFMQVQHATFHILQMGWRPEETLKALPKRNNPPLKQGRSHMQDIHHHSTRRSARLVLHPATAIHQEFRRTRIFVGFYQRIFIQLLDQEKV